MDQPGMVAIPARGQLNRKNCFFSVSSPFEPEKDRFGRPVQREPAHSSYSGWKCGVWTLRTRALAKPSEEGF